MMQKNHDWVSVYTTCEQGKRHYVCFTKNVNYQKSTHPEVDLDLFNQKAQAMFFLEQEELRAWLPDNILEHECNDGSTSEAWIGPRWYAVEKLDSWGKCFAEHSIAQGSPTIELAMKPCPVCGTQWFNDNGDICYPSAIDRSSYVAWCNVSSWGCGYEVEGSSYEEAVQAWNNASASISPLESLGSIVLTLSDRDVETIQRNYNALKEQRAWKIRDMKMVNNQLSMLGLNFSDALKTLRILMRATLKKELTT